MTGLPLFVGLLGLAYVASRLVGQGRARGLGRPSGVEYLSLGFIAGPGLLGLVDRGTLTELDSLALVGIAWSAMVFGVHFGRVGDRRVGWRGLTAALVFGLLLSAVSAAVVFLWPGEELAFLRRERLFLVLAIAAVSCDTSQQAVEWAVRRGRHGPLAGFLEEVAAAEELVPFGLALAAMAFAPEGMAVAKGPLTAVGTAVGGGVLTGVITVLLIGNRRGESPWPVLLGGTLLVNGLLLRAHGPFVPAGFALGLVLAALSPRRSELMQPLGAAEAAVLSPLLVLAGARIEVSTLTGAWPLLVVLVVVRLVAALALGAAVSVLAPGGRSIGALLGWALLPSGSVGLLIGFSFALRFSGSAGSLPLAIAALFALSGALVGLPALHAALRRVGEGPNGRAAPPAEDGAEAAGEAAGE